MTDPFDMNDSPGDTAHAFIRVARSQLEQLTVVHPEERERYIKDLLVAAAMELTDGRVVQDEWRDAYTARRSVPNAPRDVPKKTLGVLSVYEDTPESKRFALIIEALAVFSPPPRSAPPHGSIPVREHRTLSHDEVHEGALHARVPSPLIGYHTSVPNDALIAAAELLDCGATAGEICVTSGCTITITNKHVVFSLDK